MTDSKILAYPIFGPSSSSLLLNATPPPHTHTLAGGGEMLFQLIPWQSATISCSFWCSRRPE